MSTYSSPDTLNLVNKFHQAMEVPGLSSPGIPSDRVQLRVSLIQEELDELKEAIQNNDIVAVADALCDLQYVLSGTVIEFGMAEAFADLFAEVHRSNMSKLCDTIDEALDTQAHYSLKGVRTTVSRAKGGGYRVERTEDRKTLKSINYSPANLEQFL